MIASYYWSAISKKNECTSGKVSVGLFMGPAVEAPIGLENALITIASHQVPLPYFKGRVSDLNQLLGPYFRVRDGTNHHCLIAAMILLSWRRYWAFLYHFDYNKKILNSI